MDDKTALATMLAGSGVTVVGIVRWMFERQIKRLDDMESDIAELRTNKICKKDLDDTEDSLSRIIIDATDKIQRELENTSRRVDKLFERGNHI